MYKNKIYLLFIVILFANLLDAQEKALSKYSISIVGKRSNSDAYLLVKKMKNKLNKSFTISRKANFVIEPIVEVLNEKTIEGMETMTLTEVSVKFQVNNLLVEGNKWSWEKTFKGKGQNRRQSIKKGIKRFIKKDKGFKDFKEKLSEYLDKEYNENCTKYIKVANDYKSNKKFVKCIDVCNQLIIKSSCKEDASSLKKIAFEELQVNRCESILHKARLKKSIKDFDGTIRYLIRISPNSPCAQDAINLAKEIEKSIDDNMKSMKLYKIITDFNYKNEWLNRSMNSIDDY